MMDDLTDLYQQLILDHNKRPHNFGQLATCTHKADGHNPLCGDQITVYLTLNEAKITDVRFDGKGCAICKASASMMTDGLRNKTFAQAEAMFENFHALIAGEGQVDTQLLGKLAAFSGVRQFPVRVKCATLAWHTLRAALKQQSQPVNTEEAEATYGS